MGTIVIIAVVLLCAVFLLGQWWRDKTWDLDDREYEDTPLWRQKR